MPDLTYQLVTGRWTYVVADGLGRLADPDSDPDEVGPTGKVEFVPRIGGNVSLLTGSPTRSVALGVVPGLVVDGVLHDLNGIVGVRLATKIGANPVYWTATPTLTFGKTEIPAKIIEFGPGNDVTAQIHLNDLQGATDVYPAPVIGQAQTYATLAGEKAAAAASSASAANASRLAAQQAAADAAATTIHKADLDSNNKVPLAQLPERAIVRYLGPVASQAAMLALVGDEADWCVRTDTGTHWVIVGTNPAQIASWKEIPLPASALTKATADVAYAPSADTAGFDSGAGTRKLASALQRAFTAAGICDIGIVGDSVTTAYTGAAFDFPGAWYRRLKATLVADGYADGGSGWVAAVQGDLAAVDPRWTIGANWDRSPYSYMVSTANGAVATFTSEASGTAVEVTYGNTANPFTVSIDGGTAVTVTPNGSPAVKVYAVTGLTNTTHTVTITAQSSAVIVGVQVKAAAGVRFHSLGKYGMNAESFATDVFSLKTAAVTAVPNLDAVVIMVGANDLTSGKTPAATVDRLREIRQVWPNADAILAVEPQTTTEVTTAVWNDFQARIRALGVELSCPVIDLHRRWGGSTTSAALGFVGADNKHPNANGQRDIASAYLRSLRQAYTPPTTFAPQTGPGSPDAALTTATGRAAAFAIVLG